MKFYRVEAGRLRSLISYFIRPGEGGGGVLPIMAYTGRLRPKGVPFSAFRYIKRWGFHKLRYMKG